MRDTLENVIISGRVFEQPMRSRLAWKSEFIAALIYFNNGGTDSCNLCPTQSPDNMENAAIFKAYYFVNQKSTISRIKTILHYTCTYMYHSIAHSMNILPKMQEK